jgi:hypothetical protein
MNWNELSFIIDGQMGNFTIGLMDADGVFVPKDGFTNVHDYLMATSEPYRLLNDAKKAVDALQALADRKPHE